MTQAILEDVLVPGLRLVICGSAAGERSARLGAYYAGLQNRFWLTLHEVGLTPRVLRPDEFRTLPAYGIGLTDIVKHQAGNDRELRPRAHDAAELCTRIEAVAPHVLAFNGKRAAQQYLARRRIDYGEQAETIGTTRLFVVPSTSAAARAFWDVGHWQALARLVCDTSPS